jgi:glycosyltransferase involved in cell wall biosynthesis
MRASDASRTGGTTGTRLARISVVTPCRNAERYIRETALSVLQQTAVESGRVELEYIVLDGKSTDGTLEVLKSLGSKGIRVVSERDDGMYDALAKGLRSVTGHVVAYLNAGDYYHKSAFDVVLDVMESKGAAWVTGLNVIYNDQSQVVATFLPYRYRREFLQCGLYDGRHLPFVQQESTFWRSELHQLVDFDRLAKLRYAGDAYLWSCFARGYELRIVNAYLGGFRSHAGQLSEQMESYRRELRSISAPPTLMQRIGARVDRLLWHAPPRLKKSLSGDGLYSYDHALEQWR